MVQRALVKSYRRSTDETWKEAVSLTRCQLRKMCRKFEDIPESDSSSYKSAQLTLNWSRKRVKTEVESDSAAGGRQAKPKWSVLRSARASLSMLSTLGE